VIYGQLLDGGSCAVFNPNRDDGEIEHFCPDLQDLFVRKFLEGV
jgi:hypothetical protein